MVFGMQEYCGGQFNDVVYKFYDAEEFGDMLVEFNKIQKHEIKESHIHVFNQHKLCSFVMSCYFKRMKFLYGKLTQDMFL